jgi:hypothetical protein
VLVDTDGHVADDVFVDAGLTLELSDDRARCVDVEHHEMRLAVAFDLVGEGLEAPGLGLEDLAFVRFDDFGRRGRQRVNLGL